MKYTEYRVVCTKDEHHNYNGKDFHYEVAQPVMYPSLRIRKIYRDKAEAEKALEQAIRECPELDAKHDNERRDNIKIKQYNFRIQTREVTEWEDIEA